MTAPKTPSAPPFEGQAARTLTVYVSGASFGELQGGSFYAKESGKPPVAHRAADAVYAGKWIKCGNGSRLVVEIGAEEADYLAEELEELASFNVECAGGMDEPGKARQLGRTLYADAKRIRDQITNENAS